MPIDLSAGANDPYTQLLTQLQQSILQGNPQFSTGGTSQQTTETTQRPTGPEEASAYQTAFGGLLGPTFGQIPESQLSGYFDLAQPYLFGTGMEKINQTLAQAGFGPGASSPGAGAAPIGPQAELASRLRAQLAVPQANALIENAMTGAKARGEAGLSIGKSRYSTLTLPNTRQVMTRTAAEQKPGTGGVSVQYPSQSAEGGAGGGASGGGGRGGAGGGGSSVPTGAQGAGGGSGWYNPATGTIGVGIGDPGIGDSGYSSIPNYFTGATSPDWSPGAGGAFPIDQTQYSDLGTADHPTGAGMSPLTSQEYEYTTSRYGDQMRRLKTGGYDNPWMYY